MPIIQVYECPKCKEIFKLGKKKNYISHLKSHASQKLFNKKCKKFLYEDAIKFNEMFSEPMSVKNTLQLISENRKIVINNHTYHRSEETNYQFLKNFFEINEAFTQEDCADNYYHYVDKLIVNGENYFGIVISNSKQLNLPKKFLTTSMKKFPRYYDIGCFKYFSNMFSTASSILFVVACNESVENYTKYKAEMKLISI